MKKRVSSVLKQDVQDGVKISKAALDSCLDSRERTGTGWMEHLLECSDILYKVFSKYVPLVDAWRQEEAFKEDNVPISEREATAIMYQGMVKSGVFAHEAHNSLFTGRSKWQLERVLLFVDSMDFAAPSYCNQSRRYQQVSRLAACYCKRDATQEQGN
jgi:hypothetical protein